jgi:NAD(P)-dependent dehydrogenase (short-subunit alcohol dehydrogenase family)
MNKRFEDKVALITGSAKGLGREIARLFAEEGANISISDIDKEGIKKTGEDFKSAGFKVVSTKMDISNPFEIKEMIDSTIRKFGKIDFLINNASCPFQKPMMDIVWEDFDPVLNVNIKGTFFVLQNVAREMIERNQGGSIVNIASLAGSGGRPLYIPYAASKAAVMNITQSAAKELAKYNIRVNSVSPGNINTGMLIDFATKVAGVSNTNLENTLDEWKNRIPLKHFAETNEIAKTVLFLSSDDASYITGQIINVCGGLSIP